MPSDALVDEEVMVYVHNRLFSYKKRWIELEGAGSCKSGENRRPDTFIQMRQIKKASRGVDGFSRTTKQWSCTAELRLPMQQTLVPSLFQDPTSASAMNPQAQKQAVGDYQLLLKILRPFHKSKEATGTPEVTKPGRQG